MNNDVCVLQFRKPKRLTVPIAFTWLILGSLSCSSPGHIASTRVVQAPLTTELLREYDLTQIRDVVVMPVTGEPLRSHPAFVRTELDTAFLRALDQETELQIRNILEPAQTQKSLQTLVPASPLAQAIELNSRLAPDGVFFVTVSKYSTTMKAQDASEVAFRAWFLPKGAPKAVWVATYEFSEQPLSENLFRMKQALSDGIRYKGAKQLCERGFRALAREFEQMRASAPRKKVS